MPAAPELNGLRRHISEMIAVKAGEELYGRLLFVQNDVPMMDARIAHDNIPRLNIVGLSLHKISPPARQDNGQLRKIPVRMVFVLRHHLQLADKQNRRIKIVIGQIVL